jgi:elongation factor Ts
MNNTDKIKKLREETGISLMQCKKACDESCGDIELAKEILRKKGQAMADKKSERETGEGMIISYIHQNKKIGVLLDIRCESDFVTRSEDFQEISKEICLQIAAMKPLYVNEEEIPLDIIEKEKEIYLEQTKDSDKPKEVIEKIIEGKIKSYIKDNCLVSQEWIKDSSKIINDLIKEKIAKIGENITIRRFTRYEI